MPSELDTPTRVDGAAHRPASVTLRARRDAEETGPMLDPANQSLAETLGFVFKILQFAMLALLVAFMFSGIGQVRENERGVKLLFGRKMADNLEPGPHFSAPYPMGELVKVDTGNVALDISESFWPRLTGAEQKMNLQQLAAMGKQSLKPGDDGSLITGDENIAHATWTVHYFRRDPAEYIQHILKEDEPNIVKAAVERGIVQAVAQVKIDDLLKQSISDQGSVARRAQKIAQDMLTEIHSGIEIEQLSLDRIAPPFVVINDFSRVQSAEQRASQVREQASSAARNLLNETAGSAHDALIKQIDEYEQAVTRGDTETQDRILARINDIFDGKEVKIGDQVLPAHAISGEVTNILADAGQYRSTIVNQREAELNSFKAKLAQFKSNPSVLVQREWTDAMAAFLDHPYVEIFNVPPRHDSLELWVGRDPSITKQYEAEQKDIMIRKSREKKAAEDAAQKFNTDTGVAPVDLKALPR